MLCLGGCRYEGFFFSHFSLFLEFSVLLYKLYGIFVLLREGFRLLIKLSRTSGLI